MQAPPADSGFRTRLRGALAVEELDARLDLLMGLSHLSLGYVETIQLDKALSGVAAAIERRGPPLRLALLSSATIDHLVPAIRVAGLRRGLLFEVFAGGFGQYRREVLDPDSKLRAFAPDVVILSLSARPVVNSVPITAHEEQVERALAAEIEELRALWEAVRSRHGASVIQQTY